MVTEHHANMMSVIVVPTHLVFLCKKIMMLPIVLEVGGERANCLRRQDAKPRDLRRKGILNFLSGLVWLQRLTKR